MSSARYRALALGVGAICLATTLGHAANVRPARRSLLDEARANGGVLKVARSPFRADPYQSLEALVADTEGVLLVSVMDVRSELTPDDSHVETRVRVRVERLVAGRIPHVGDLVIRQSGGGIVYPGGVSVTVDSFEEASPLEAERRYVIFVRRRQGANGYELVGGPQGQFEVLEDGKLIPGDRRRLTAAHSKQRRPPLVMRYAGVDVGVLMGDVKALAKATFVSTEGGR